MNKGKGTRTSKKTNLVSAEKTLKIQNKKEPDSSLTPTNDND